MSDDDIIVNVVGELPEFEGLRPIGVLTKLTPAAAGLVPDPAWRNRCATCGAVAVDGWCHHCADRGDGYDPRDFIEDGAA